jgi:glycosyltransferase involved in cell wall biosynthesis
MKTNPRPDDRRCEEPEAAGRLPSVSVIVPAFNESAILAHNVGILCDHMRGLEDQYRWELIIINDGSSDGTGEIADCCAENHRNVYVLHHPYNFRLGQALRFAFSQARGDYVVVMDADLSYAPYHIERMLKKISASRAKVVIASPYMEGGTVANGPWFRKLLSQWANKYLCMTVTRDRFSDKVTTVTGMVRAYDREFLSSLNLKAMDVDINAEILYKAMILRARIVEVPADLDWGTEQSRAQQFKIRRSSLRVIRSIIQSLISGFMFRPFAFFVFPGIFFVGLSLYPLLWTLINTLDNLNGLSGQGLSLGYRLSEAIGMVFRDRPHAFVVGGFALIVGIQLFNLGLMALQSKRYFEELFFFNTSIYKALNRKGREGPPEKITRL